MYAYIRSPLAFFVLQTTYVFFTPASAPCPPFTLSSTTESAYRYDATPALLSRQIALQSTWPLPSQNSAPIRVYPIFLNFDRHAP